MKKFTTFALLGSASLVLAACGSAEDASTEATADTVEMPADEALEGLSDEPVEDEAAAIDEEVAGPAAVTQETAETAAENAADVAAQVEAAAAEAEAAANQLDEAVDAAEAAADNATE
ncbi:MAG: hypothetical protein AAF250_11805 [Pseudomonadota bacterium]